MTTSEQARKDAMADAETLRLMECNDQCFPEPAYSDEAGVYGLASVWCEPPYDIERARDAARAAFRACPGLEPAERCSQACEDKAAERYWTNRDAEGGY